jgi:hypothetical protein
MANELTKNLQVCFFLAYFGTWGNGTKVQYSNPPEVAFPRGRKFLCVVEAVSRGWKGKIFYVQPALPNTLIALHRRHARKNEVNTGTNHLGFRCVKDKIDKAVASNPKQ